MKLTLKIWRQKNAKAAGQIRHLPVDDVNADMSILEMLDMLNEHLIAKGEEPVAFEHDCREGICGIVRLHDQRRRPRPACRHHRLPAHHAPFQRWRRAVLEPWRARPFPS